jgi:hypothetical protein
MKKLLGSLALALLVASSTFAAAGSRMVCEKTGTIVESCCCVHKDGALVCTLTGETVSSCCCTPAK